MDGKKIAFFIVLALVIGAVYWFIIRPKLAAKGAMLPKDPTITAARNQYELQMMSWIKSNDPDARSWFNAAQQQYDREGATKPFDEFLLEGIRSAAQGQSAEFVHTVGGVLQWRGPVRTLYGF